MGAIDQEQVWSARYAGVGEDYLFGTVPNAFLQDQAVRLTPRLSALSVADGEGRNSVWLAEEGLTVTAVEISPVALHKARRLAESRRAEVSFIQADLMQWDWPMAAYDVVVAIFIQFVGPAERAILFSRLKQALKPGGLLLMQGYTPKQLEYGTGGPSVVENLYTEALLRESFKDFEILELRSHETVIEEGCAHRGMSALIDLVARKLLR
ncbi:SAM-dependent methyltransferase [Denitratisoma oestradiolicum]|uniref:SAM-dependent methyltransferase n=1 Tax=Denitratisoma oestradiolicum TaxID=311182 RepID=A0A6S6XWS9_9PROT|nr:class I SAM-dependent methyltransferase [Denitratisoma oestradiolicum]TWO81364.1 SAM-dependent methyltransferase [Denitratisoma oestradiolicum]CAB1368557.1 SAM-dependent methyltransferase [Denitratisoma oestradiolicum]